MEEKFEEFWKRYPRRVGKGAARKAYAKALKVATHEEIMAGLRTFVIAEPWHGDIQFCPHPSTWLNQERWADEYDTPGSAVDDALLEAARRADEEEENGQQQGTGTYPRLVQMSGRNV